MTSAGGLLTRSVMKQIERSRTRMGGRRVVTDDINKLKGLTVKPVVPEDDLINYYVEPVTIEYYIPKESRFAFEIKYLYIKLYDPEPNNEIQRKIMGSFKEEDKPIDVIEVMNRFPEHLPAILQYYSPTIHLHEAVSMQFQLGFTEDPIAIRRAMYLCEILHKLEPTVPALELLGQYTLYNINWCVRFLNRNEIEHTLEDTTTEFLIKRHRNYCARNGIEVDERFDILANIYLEQAFSHNDDDDLDDD